MTGQLLFLVLTRAVQGSSPHAPSLCPEQSSPVSPWPWPGHRLSLPVLPRACGIAPRLGELLLLQGHCCGMYLSTNFINELLVRGQCLVCQSLVCCMFLFEDVQRYPLAGHFHWQDIGRGKGLGAERIACFWLPGESWRGCMEARQHQDSSSWRRCFNHVDSGLGGERWWCFWVENKNSNPQLNVLVALFL